MAAEGMSMPVTSASSRRNGVDEGQAPVQMPQPAQRFGSTCAWRGCGRASVRATIVTASYGQSAKQRAQPLQLARFTRAAGARGTRVAQGRSAIAPRKASVAAHSPAGPSHAMSGCGKR